MSDFSYSCSSMREYLNSDIFGQLEKEYLEYIHNFECIACYLGYRNFSKTETIAHHENLSYCYRNYKRFTDFSVIPLCDYHHKERHDLGFSITYRKWFGNENVVYVLVFNLIKEFFNKKEDFRREKIAEEILREVSLEDILTNRKLFDKLLVWIAKEE